MSAEWWSNLETFQKILWVIAVPATVALIIQLILTFIGGDVDADVDLDTDAEVEADHGMGFQFFTLKNMIAFFTVFSWTTLGCLDMGMSQLASIGVGIIAGLLIMTVMASIFYFAGKLQESGSLNMQNALNAEGEVYLTIPKNKEGMGKIQIKIQGSLRELDAVTKDDVDLTRGQIVRVTEVSSNNILTVTKS